MKKFALFVLCLSTCFAASADIRVVSNTALGKGYYPRFADDQTITCFSEESAGYDDVVSDDALRVDNEDLTLNLYRNGVKIVLTPHGTDVNYIWASLSPNKQYILFNTMRGTAVCDLNGREIINFGQGLDAPVWYGNDYVVGMNDCSDSHQYTASSIVIASVDGKVRQTLTNPSEFGMYPAVDAVSGRIVYNTLDGDLHLLQLNLTEQPIRRTAPAIKTLRDSRSKMFAAQRRRAAANAKPSDFRIYINPGHGGYTSDDRNIVIYPFAQGDTLGFYESTSNLHKGLKLDTLLREVGFQTKMSRVLNRQDDDRALSAIVEEANAWNSDYMLSIHSNAGGPSNYVLMLYAGIDLDDPQQSYPTPTPCSDESREISTLIGNYLCENAITTWTASVPRIAGDKTFARTAMGWSNGYGVLRGLRVPGVISEGCMHDYHPETYRLMNMDYKYKESYYFRKVFMEYFCHTGMSTGAIGGQVRDAFNKMLFPAITKIRNSRDERLPIDRATIDLLKEGKKIASYTTDTLYNGVFFFWDLEPGEYTLHADVDHYYTVDSTITVTANNIAYKDLMLQMRRETRPKVTSYSPNVVITDSVNVATPIVLNFNWDMWEEPTRAAFSISPAVEGTLTFENSQRTLRFTPKTAYEPGTEYTVTLAKSAAHPDTNYPNTLAEDFVMRFRTLNRPCLSVMLTYPAEGETDIDLKPSIFMLFDEKLHKESNYKLFSVSDNGDFTFVPASRNFKKNTVDAPYGSVKIDVTTELKPNTQYKVVVEPTVKDTDNIILSTPFVLNFTTGAGAVSEKEGEMIMNLDDVAFEVEPEKTVALEDKMIRTGGSTKRTEGTGSNDIVYTFDANEPDAHLFLKPLDLTHVFTSRDKMVIDIYGDFTMNEVYAEFSTAGDIHTYRLCNLDFIGWKTITLDLSQTDLPVGVDFQFTGLSIVRTTVQPILCNTGEIFLDRLAIVKGQNTAVDAPQTDTTNATAYDLLGRPAATKQDRQVYIQNGKKHIINK